MGTHNSNLKNAIKFLIYKGVINNQQEVAIEFGIDESTLTRYIKGQIKKVPDEFIMAFENRYSIALSEFDKPVKAKMPKAVAVLDFQEAVYSKLVKIESQNQVILEELAKNDPDILKLLLRRVKLLSEGKGDSVNELHSVAVGEG